LYPCADFNQEFGLKIEAKFVELKSRYLDQPDLWFGGPNNGTFKMSLKDKLTGPKKATWNLMDRTFRKVQDKYPKLSIILIVDETNKSANAVEWRKRRLEDAKNFAEHLKNALGKYGFETSKYQIVPVQEVHGTYPTERRKLFSDGLTNAHNALRQASRDDADQLANKAPLVVILMQNDDATVFSDIKWWADCIRGVPSVCVTGATVTRDKNAGGDENLLANLRLAKHLDMSMKANKLVS
jgi:hypothetical protein